MILASSWAELVGSLATVLGAAAVPWGVYVYRADVRRRQQEREDNLSKQARLVSVSVEPEYALGTRLSPRVVGGLTGVRYFVINGSDGPIRHVSLEVSLPWASRPKHVREFDLIPAGAQAKGLWDLGGATLALPKGQNQLGRGDIRAVATLMGAEGLWWQVERGKAHPLRLFTPLPGTAPPFEPLHVRMLRMLRRPTVGELRTQPIADSLDT